jgi:hypothetical protein
MGKKSAAMKPKGLMADAKVTKKKKKITRRKKM